VSKRAYATVLQSFPQEIAGAYGFLASELGLSGPLWSTVVAPSAVFTAPGHRYRIVLDTQEMTVGTSFELDLDGTRLSARLDDLVGAARLRSHGRLSRSARTLHDLRGALASQAGFVRLLHPLLTGAGAPDLLEQAGARRLR
jgi:hypothetical protein